MRISLGSGFRVDPVGLAEVLGPCLDSGRATLRLPISKMG